MPLPEIQNLGVVQKLRWQRKWRGGGETASWLGGGRGPAKRRVKTSEGEREGGSPGLRTRDGFSSHTSNYCVTGD